jgi:hypothetical protein
MKHILHILIFCFLALAFNAINVKAQTPQWTGMGNTDERFYNDISTIFSDASGNIYAGGDFGNARGFKYVSKWDGTKWNELGGANALRANSYILSVCSDASGNIYSAGGFTNTSGKRYVAKWDGSAWSELGGTNAFSANSVINSICSDATGNVYAAGIFSNASGKRYVAKWNGSTWSELGGLNALSANNTIFSICSDPSGNIYAAGAFTNAGGSKYVAKWDGTAWSEVLGANALLANDFIRSIFADSTGNIYAAGNFSNSNGKKYVAKWNGNMWSELGGTNSLVTNVPIESICKDVAGNIYASFFVSYSLFTVVKWNGTSWSQLGGANALSANSNISSICSDAYGNIYAGGSFTNGINASYSGKRYVAKWNGSIWSELGGSNNWLMDNQVFTACTDNNGGIYIAGDFRNLYGKYYVAKWDGSTWKELGGTNGLAGSHPIYCLCTDPLGNIYASGNFENSSGYRYVAKWDGSNWSELGAASSFHADDAIKSICSDPYGNIYAGGYYTNASGKYYVSKWDGSTWSELVGTNALSANGEINSICSDNLGNIYVAGDFSNGVSSIIGSKYVAKWDGSAWSELGGTNALSANSDIYSICSDVAGNIYAAGKFSNGNSSGGGNKYVAKWNGISWSELGYSNALAANNLIQSICSDAAGNIYAGGDFTNGFSSLYGSKYVAKWNGTNWSELGGPNSLATVGVILGICADASGNVYAGAHTQAYPSGRHWLSKFGTTTINANGSTTICEGDSVTLSGNNGGIWSNGSTAASITVGSSGTYSVLSSSYGNVMSNSIVVTVNPLPIAPAISAMGNTTLCDGSSVMLMGNNNGTWSDGSTDNDTTVNATGNYYVVSSNSCGTDTSNIIGVIVNSFPIAPTISTMGNTTICEGNSLMLVGNNGSIWSNGSTSNDLTVNTAGNYYVINSNNCGSDTSNVISITINPLPLAPSISAIGNTVICEGNSAMLIGNIGGIWSNGSTANEINVNATGNYYVVSSNSCGFDTSNIISINVNTLLVAPNISAMGNTTICEGNSVILMGNNGGTWSNNSTSNDITVNAAGNYYVVSSNSCGNDTSNIISINVNPLPIAPSVSAIGSTNLCFGNSLMLTGNNGGIWNDGSTAADTLIYNQGAYFVTTTNNCGSTVSNTINVNQISVETTVTIGNASFLANASNATYQWLLCNGTYSPVPSETNQTFTPSLVSGFYAVEVTQNGCVDTSACYTLILTGLTNSSKMESLELYPNPANNYLTIDNGKLKIETLTILNTLGEIVFYKQNCNALETIDVSGFASGIYIVRANQTSIKFIKQ